MKRPIATVIAALFMLGLLAGPAAAEPKEYLIPPGAGIAQVSKTSFFDANCNVNAPLGRGLGIPIVNGVKKGYWRIAAPLIGIPLLNDADLLACGQLNPVARRAGQRIGQDGIGAACGMSKGYNGRGYIDDSEDKGYIIRITNLVWKTTEGGLIVATGHVTWEGKDTNKGPGKIIAVVNAQGAADCATKQTSSSGFHKKNNASKTGGANNFIVNGGAYIIQGQLAEETPKIKDMPTSDKGDQDNPAFCKDADEVQCPIYGPKKKAD